MMQAKEISAQYWIFRIALMMCFAIFIWFSVSSCNQGQQQSQSADKTQQDLSSHSIYSNYNFDRSGKVISFGVQPLYMPTGLIIEVIKRDHLLKHDLSSLDLELQFFSFLKGKDVNFFMLRNDISVGVGGDMPTLTLAVRGDIIIPALIQNGPVSIVTRKHMLLTDLRGKKIGYASGSNAHYVLLDFLSTVGLLEQDVKLVSLEVNMMVEALRNGEIDAFAAWEPTPQLGKIQYSFVKGHQSFSSGFLYFDRNFFSNFPEALNRIIASEIRAINWIKSSKENLTQASKWAIKSAERLSGKKSLLSDKEYVFLAEQDILNRYSTKPYDINKSYLKNNGLLHNEFQFLKDLGILPPGAKWEKVKNSFNLKIVQKIIQENEKFKLQEFDYNQLPVNR
jgi:hypothetical protein